MEALLHKMLTPHLRLAIKRLLRSKSMIYATKPFIDVIRRDHHFRSKVQSGRVGKKTLEQTNSVATCYTDLLYFMHNVGTSP